MAIVTARRPTVLIVDHDVLLRRVLEQTLTKEGYEVLGASSPETAYDLLTSQRADALLLDIQLPTMSGLALYLAITNRWPALVGRIAIMTGDPEAEEARPWLLRNPCPVLRKPFNMREILDWLRTVTRAPRHERGNR